MENKNLTAVNWLEKTIKGISVGRASTSRYKDMILKLISEAKEMETEGLNRLNEYWVNSKEQSVHAAKMIGFRKGVQAGLINAEDYWEEHREFQDGPSFLDETEFNNNFIDELWEIENME